MKLALCSDHAGYELKSIIEGYLQANGIDYTDFGTFSAESCDYPDFAHAAAEPSRKGNAPWASPCAALATASP